MSDRVCWTASSVKSIPTTAPQLRNTASRTGHRGARGADPARPRQHRTRSVGASGAAITAAQRSMIASITAHGGQQLAFWNAHHDERGFASMHIYDVAS